ncbi:hypothetical protein V8J88_14260 [Massilia sp. W12]|uniref:hypothetical protein n=1 Tax=Massilia sp. W12 TaxID=3126507 RepID=UPI0030D117CA
MIQATQYNQIVSQIARADASFIRKAGAAVHQYIIQLSAFGEFFLQGANQGFAHAIFIQLPQIEFFKVGGIVLIQLACGHDAQTAFGMAFCECKFIAVLRNDLLHIRSK